MCNLISNLYIAFEIPVVGLNNVKVVKLFINRQNKAEIIASYLDYFYYRAESDHKLFDTFQLPMLNSSCW